MTFWEERKCEMNESSLSLFYVIDDCRRNTAGRSFTFRTDLLSRLLLQFHFRTVVQFETSTGPMMIMIYETPIASFVL
jgi:hypothetical protein